MITVLRGISSGFLTLVLVLSAGACSPPPPPDDPPEPTPEPPPPEPPPKPTCKAMKDRCKAESDTEATIPGVDYVFTPPEGWEYALLEEATVTQKGDDGPVLVVTSIEFEKTNYKSKPIRTKMVKALSDLVGIEAPKRLSFTKAQKKKYSDLPMLLWGDEAKRAEEKGAFFYFAAQVDKRELFGIGFAAVGDKDNTKLILDSLKTFKVVEKEGDDDDDDDEDKDKDGKKK